MKKNGSWFIQEPEISSQFLGTGKTKSKAKEDYNDSLNNIFSDSRDRKKYKLK